MNEEREKKQRKTRFVCVCVSRRRQPLEGMHVTYATLQQTNEKIVCFFASIIEFTALAYTAAAAAVCDRRDVEMLLFYFPLVPSFSEFLFRIRVVVVAALESVDKDVNFRWRWCGAPI